MLKKISLIIIFAFIFVFLATPVLAEDYGLSATAGAAELTDAGTNLPAIIGNIIGTALSLVAVVFFGLMLYGGFMWMTARGNEQNSTKALDTIFAAIIGIIIVLSSYAITNFVLNAIYQ